MAKNNMTRVSGARNFAPTVFDWFARPLADLDLFKDDGALSMKTDVIDKGDRYELKADLPGFDKKDLKVDFKDGVLTVSAARSAEKQEQQGGRHGYVVHERSEGSCQRQFCFEDADPQGISASFSNGELEISLKKAEKKSEGRQIDVH
ncbi:MAG: Hsp20/alpha crystallin family protein [Succinivibrio sp.]|jgi:HSP20 family protein|nr:Hsp20/alpha crystallin family protein [Succinivibrio sp.]